jgi:hypothetical protein
MHCVASFTLPPPVKPRSSSKTNQKSRTYYTLHTGRNDAFTLRVDEQSRTSVVGFTEWDNAMFVGQMLETYFIAQMEWPPTYEVGALILPSPQKPSDVLRHLYIQQWEFDELQMTCTKNFLDMISIDDILKKQSQNGYVFSGKTYMFDAPIEFYRERFDEIWELKEF